VRRPAQPTGVLQWVDVHEDRADDGLQIQSVPRPGRLLPSHQRQGSLLQQLIHSLTLYLTTVTIETMHPILKCLLRFSAGFFYLYAE